jgi:hypothetical protein
MNFAITIFPTPESVNSRIFRVKNVFKRLKIIFLLFFLIHIQIFKEFSNLNLFSYRKFLYTKKVKFDGRELTKMMKFNILVLFLITFAFVALAIPIDDIINPRGGEYQILV